jgi:hypothetical protein
MIAVVTDPTRGAVIGHGILHGAIPCHTTTLLAEGGVQVRCDDLPDPTR